MLYYFLAALSYFETIFQMHYITVNPFTLPRLIRETPKSP